MRKFFPVEELARDERFHQVTMKDRMADPRSAIPARPPASGHAPTGWCRADRTPARPPAA
jgi:hypothetical protein